MVLSANVRLDWKVIAGYKHSSLFGLVVSNEDDKFSNVDVQVFITVSAVWGHCEITMKYIGGLDRKFWVPGPNDIKLFMSVIYKCS
jgi:hypothetical protein